MSENLYDIHVTRATGEEITLREYQGKVMLIVNVASACGYTPQYDGLEVLFNKYQAKGLAVLAFPCNDFGAQEPGTMDEILRFCSTNFGVTFDLFQKLHAKGDKQHPLYAFLTSNADPEGDVRWNFEKFVIGKTGQIIARYGSGVTPADADLTSVIERELTNP